MNRILITTAYSYTFRNIVLSGVLNELLKEYHIKLLAPKELINKEIIKELKCKYKNLETDILITPKSKSIVNLLFTFVSNRIIALQNTNSLSSKIEMSKQLNRKWYLKFIFSTFPFKTNKLILDFLTRLLHKIHNTEVKNEIYKFNPQLYISTTGNKLDEVFYLNSCKKMKIKTLNIINSWDVITTKGSYYFNFDYTFVWNDYNKEQYKKYINQKLKHDTKVMVTGAPHFDHYKTVNHEKIRSIREKYLKHYNILPTKNIVMFAASPHGIAPNEDEIIIQLLKSKMLSNCFFIIRLHPQCRSILEKYDLKEYKNCIITNNSPLIKTKDNANFQNNFFNDLITEISVADYIISTASTITVEGALLSKSCANLYFSPINKKIDKIVKSYYEREHYIPISKNNSITKLYNTNDIIKYLSGSNIPQSYLCDFLPNEKGIDLYIKNLKAIFDNIN